MKFYTILFLIFSTVFVSCTKTREVHFKGRVTMECNNQPVKGVGISFHRYYDDGMMQGETIGYTNTDNDGYYSYITDVGQYDDVGITIAALANSEHPEIYFHSYSINPHFDYQARFRKIFFFHIKNSNPNSNSDLFNFLIVNASYDDIVKYDTLISNLIGTSVDTLINMQYFNFSGISYSFTKNGTLQNIDSLFSHSGCFDTLLVNVYY